MLRGGQDRFCCALLHYPALVHYRHVMGKTGDHADIVGNKQVCQPQFLLQACQQLQYPGLYRHVQGACRFITNQQFRSDSQRPGNTDALSLPAGKLMRITIFKIRFQADLVK